MSHKWTEETKSTVLTEVNLRVNEDRFTERILQYIGNLCVYFVNKSDEIYFDLPESISDLLVFDGTSWYPMIGAFTDEDHLYIIVDGGNDLYIFSPTSPKDYIRYIDHETYVSDEFRVNHLLEDHICRAEPLSLIP